jgi:uncharacterized protein involved in outer membrane biogenesis
MDRRRLFKLAFLSAAALVAGGAIALCVFVDRAASAPELKPRIEEAASAFLGRPLTIGALEWRRWPDAALLAKDVRLYEDPLKRRLLADAPSVEARVAVLSLFKLAAGITELRFLSPRVRLRRDKNGEWNAVRVADEIAARPEEPARRWGSLAFNWFSVENGTVTVEDADGAWGSLPPIEVQGRGKLRFGRRRLHFPFELSGRLRGSGAALEITGDLGGRSRFRVDVKNGEPSLARLAWPPAARWSGRWDGTLDYDERPTARWRLRARVAPLAVSTAAPRLDSLELAGDYVPLSSATFAVAARSPGTAIDASGSAENGAFDLSVKSSKADLNELAAFVRAVGAAAPAKRAEPPVPAPRRASAAPRRLTATISADDLRYGGMDFRDVRAVVRRSTGPYALERLTFQGLGGSIEASGSYLPSAGDDALEVVWKSSGVAVQDLFRLAGSTLEAAGVADSEGRLATGLGDRFLPAMSGTVKLDVKNGWFGGMPGLLKVLARLNLATLFAEAAGRHRSRVPFDEARGAVKIAKGRVSAEEPLVLENKTLQMAFLGTYDLPSRTVDGKIVVNFLTVTDEIIGLIPGVRDILLGDEKGLIPIWVKVKGRADDPDIDVLSARTIAAPVWNTLGHILRLPKTLFDKLKPPPAPRP